MSSKAFSEPKPRPRPRPDAATKGKDGEKGNRLEIATMADFVVEKISDAVNENIPEQIKDLPEPYSTRLGYLAIIGLVVSFFVFFTLQFQSGLKTKFISLQNDGGLCTNVSKGKKKLEFICSPSCTKRKGYYFLLLLY